MNEKTNQIEFIESYIKHGNSDYEWNDNHGELVRCKDCQKSMPWDDEYVRCMNAKIRPTHVPVDWFCADGERD